MSAANGKTTVVRVQRCDCGCELGECKSGGTASIERLKDWVLSQKARGNLTREQVELFEQAIEDVEVGKW